ncbi:GNAT family N-acetyltransferase [Methylophaga lonarensis]|uniref:GNAT family N-acetyltransferase n=1 Tax=Methylophaga lonarensis TaxID=999151 RepID=UPI003D2791C3
MTLPSRRCLILSDPQAEHWQQIEAWFLQHDEQRRLWLAAEDDVVARSQRRAQDYLGQELDLLVFDGSELLRADSLAAIFGCLCAGGVLLLILPAQPKQSRWQQRLQNIARQCALDSDAIQWWQSSQKLPEPQCHPSSPAESVTLDQQQAITAIEKVLTGHRRRPLVLTADRGRGKSAALGMAAAQLMQQGRKVIGLTAPSKASVASVFKHALQALPDAQFQADTLYWQDRQLQFIPPDRLLAEQPVLDLLLVDEAAAIPMPMLTEMLNQYSRIVFSSTVHGYEGSGRGFATRFRQCLDQHAPGWHSHSLHTPIRWAANDQLEAFSFRALLLDAELAELDMKTLPDRSEWHYVEISADDLLANEAYCQQISTLLVQAHYRTRPSDLQLLLDQPDLRLFVLQANEQILACLWLVAEGPLNAELADAVYAGERRLRGALLPQTLLAHTGLPDAGQYHYQRIVRIAVHPNLQGRGLGTSLLQQVETELDTEMLGTSFALSEPLLRFWLANGYQPVRPGLTVDHVSGRQALVMLKAVSTSGQQLLQQAQTRLAQQWPYLLSQSLRQLPVAEVVLLSGQLPVTDVLVDPLQQQEVEAFALRQRGLAFSQFSLQRWLWSRLNTPEFAKLSQQQQAILVRLLLQQWSQAELVEALALPGKNTLLQQCRQAVQLLL